jgi:hypothetical protein
VLGLRAGDERVGEGERGGWAESGPAEGGFSFFFFYFDFSFSLISFSFEQKSIYIFLGVKIFYVMCY